MEKLGTLCFLIGKMGAGKSTYSQSMAGDASKIVISEDDWLSVLYPDEISNFDDFLVRHARLLELIKPHVQNILRSGVSVVMDFPANTIDSRKWFLGIANEVGADHQAVYLKASDSLCLERLAMRRIQQPERAKFDNEEVFRAVTQYFESPQIDEALSLKVIDVT
jgi:predicted kinase